VGNATAFPKWTRPRLFHNQTNLNVLDKTDSRSAALGMTKERAVVFSARVNGR
jgi:hypothetical protein